MATYEVTVTFAESNTFNTQNNTTFTTGDSLILDADMGFSTTEKEDRDLEIILSRVVDAYQVKIIEISGT